MIPRAIEIDVDEIVLTGFPELDRQLVLDAMRIELARLMVERPPTADRVDSRPVEIEATRSSAQLGTRLARAIHRRLVP